MNKLDKYQDVIDAVRAHVKAAGWERGTYDWRYLSDSGKKVVTALDALDRAALNVEEHGTAVAEVDAAAREAKAEARVREIADRQIALRASDDHERIQAIEKRLADVCDGQMELEKNVHELECADHESLADLLVRLAKLEDRFGVGEKGGTDIHDNRFEECSMLKNEPNPLGRGTLDGAPILEIQWTHIKYDTAKRGWIIHGLGMCEECRPGSSMAEAKTPPAPRAVAEEGETWEKAVDEYLSTQMSRHEFADKIRAAESAAAERGRRELGKQIDKYLIDQDLPGIAKELRALLTPNPAGAPEA